jgi:hypothetical protein
MGPTGADGLDGLDGTTGPIGPTGANGLDGTTGSAGVTGPTGPSASANSETVMVSSTANTDQAAPGATIAYVPLAGLSHSFTVPAGESWKIHATTHGTAFNLGTLSDCAAQYEYFTDGTESDEFQRTYIADGSTSLTFAYGVWTIAASWTFGPGAHTIEVRGAHAGPSGTGTIIRLAASSGFVGESFMSLIIVK